MAKAWLVELVAIAPLERAARLPGPRFAEDAPRLCAAIAAALASEAALDDLEPGGPLAPLAAGSGHLAAAPSPLEAVTALEALRAVVWAAILQALDRPVPVQVAELAERLATIVATLTSAAIESQHPLGPTRPGDRGPLAAVLRRPEPARAGDLRDAPAADAPRDDTAHPRDTARRGAAGAPRDDTHVYVEDFGGEAALPSFPAATEDRWSVRGDEPPPDDVAPPASADVAPPASADGRAPSTGDVLAQIEATLRDAATAADPLAEAASRLRSLAQDVDLGFDEAQLDPHDPFDLAAQRLRTEALPLDEPRIRRLTPVEDATAFGAPRVAPWSAAIARRLERHANDGLPFGVLCLEIADVDRLVAADHDQDVTSALEGAEGAVLAQLRPADQLIRERPGRYWLVTPDTDGDEARALAHRVAGAVAELEPHRGAPLQMSVGVSVCPVDATDARMLEGFAEEALFAARAAGLRVAGRPR